MEILKNKRQEAFTGTSKKDIRLYTNCWSCIFSNHDFATSATRYESTRMVYNHLLYYCSSSISL